MKRSGTTGGATDNWACPPKARWAEGGTLPRRRSSPRKSHPPNSTPLRSGQARIYSTHSSFSYLLHSTFNIQPSTFSLRLLKRRYGPKTPNVGNQYGHFLRISCQSLCQNLCQILVRPHGSIIPRSAGPTVFSRGRALPGHQPPEELPPNSEPQRGDTNVMPPLRGSKSTITCSGG